VKSAGLYVHIPFCRAKCNYCDFCSYPGLESLYSKYVTAVICELEHRASYWSDVLFDTIFFGGGTPTVIPAQDLAPVLAAICETVQVAADAEVSIEANPGTVDEQSLSDLKSAGFNRLSLGVQSFDDRELALLGRIHNRSEAVGAFGLARSVGFSNISLDLMFGLPDASITIWQSSLAQAISLVPEHLSVYALSVEEDTRLAEQIGRGDLPAPDEDLSADMYEMAEAQLARAGYRHYEISNWCRADDGYDLRWACRHNIKYWRNQRYLGLGVAAHSFDGDSRTGNTTSPDHYIQLAIAGEPVVVTDEKLDQAARQDETVMLALRLADGLEWCEFSERFGLDARLVYVAQIAELCDAGLLLVDELGMRLTARGRLLGNRVFGAFLR